MVQDMNNKLLIAGGDKIPGNKYQGKRITFDMLFAANDQEEKKSSKASK